VIQGKGLGGGARVESQKGTYNGIMTRFMHKIKEDTHWLQTKGEELLASFMMPPLQVVAAAVNFCTLLVTSKHLFTIPFKSMDDIKHTGALIADLSKKAEVAPETKRF
jgi:hypothetical protein